MNHALIELPQDPEAPHAQLYTLPVTLADPSGKLNASIVPILPLSEAADGHLVLDIRKFHDLTATEPSASFPYRWTERAGRA